MKTSDRGTDSEDDLLAEVKVPAKARNVLRKLDKFLLWKFFVLTVLCYLDRTNLAFAALQLNSSLHLTGTEYGIGSGIFFLGYTLFQIPSNLALMRFGARKWLGFLVVIWGIVAALFTTLKSVPQFYVLRFLLGAAESGTLPGMWYHLSLFYSENELTASWSWVLVGIALSQVIGGPIAAGFLAMDGIGELKGWQWLFLIEGALTVVMGIYVAFTLADLPSNANFLNEEERIWLHQRNADLKAKAVSRGAGMHAWDSLKNYRTWHLAAISMVANIPKYGIIFWCPLIIDSILGGKEKKAIVALLSALPFVISAVAILANAHHSKLTGERRWHVAIPLLVAAVALGVLAALIQNEPKPAFAALLVAAVVWAPDAVMASWPATFLKDAGAATGVALINSVGSIGGFLGPYIIGAIKDKGGGYTWSMVVLAVAALLVSFLSAVFPEVDRQKRRPGSNTMRRL
ncbi:Putative tartrate transporter [Coccomyxa sp. Obi]|nr:Putative tartrate transporter [Coccomyxa sp. Obi]